MMPERLCFENKKTLLFSYTQKQNYRNKFEFWFFPPYFEDIHCLFTFHYANKYNILAF